MRALLVSTTSLLALLVFGGGRALAVPITAESGNPVFGTTEQTDVVLESLSLDGASVLAAATAPSPTETQPTTDSGGQTPGSTFTYRPSAPAKRDGGGGTAVVANSRRNPGNVSNLRGTIGSAAAGIFGVPASEILVNETPAAAYNFMLRPPLSVEMELVLPESIEAVRREPFEGEPSQSVFVGVRPPVADDNGNAARRASILSATGSATPTIRVMPAPRRAGSDADVAADLGYKTDAGLATTIGFSTAHIRPTSLPLGAAASSTLGYTYVPMGRRSTLASVAGMSGSTVSATVTGSDGKPARRDWRDGDQADPRDVSADLADSPALVSSAGIDVTAVYRPPPGVSVDTFVVATADPGAISGRNERIIIPVVLKGELGEPDVAGESLYASDTVEMNTGHSVTQYAMIAGAVAVPFGLALLGFRMIRRAAIRRLE
jgi:hypothetical protein